MALPLPSSLSPSKVSTFKDCALAFRFSAIDKLPEPPSVPAVKGTTVHRALGAARSQPTGRIGTPELAHELPRRGARGAPLTATSTPSWRSTMPPLWRSATMQERWSTGTSVWRTLGPSLPSGSR